MLAKDIPVISLCARLAGRSTPGTVAPAASAACGNPRLLIQMVLAEMLPSTVEEIAEAAALEAAATLACLEKMAARNRVMFNPLTKRFSLPKVLPATEIAA
jgi:hypothetical protein